MDIIFEIHKGIWINDVFLKFGTNINEVDFNVKLKNQREKMYMKK